MNCRKCKNEIPDGSLFCNWCGEQQHRSRKKKGAELKVPKAVQMSSGNWYIRLRLDGENVNVTAPTERECIEQARAIKAGLIEQRKLTPHKSLTSAIEEYIQAHSGVLSPSTIYGYDDIKRNRFKGYSDVDIYGLVNWQKAINAEASLCSAKTLKNAWGLVARVLRYNKLDVPDVTLPQVVKKELAWLNYAEIMTFLEAVKGKPVEFAALLALHSLRRSELLAITPSKIVDGNIIVSGAVVPAVGNVFVSKETNKNVTSARTVPIMIPRLRELIEASDNAPDSPYVTICPNNIYTHLQKVCQAAGLPVVGLHGLRRSFASLAYHLGWSERKTMLIGGWSDFQTMHKMYIKLDETDIREAAASMEAFYSKSNSSTKLATKFESA